MKVILLIAFFFGISNLFAQVEVHTEDHSHHNHHGHLNEIAVANSLVYFLGEKQSAYGLHFHYVRNFKTSNFGVGLGYERIFDEHKHNTIGVLLNYRFFEKLNFSVSPGMAFEDHEPDFKFAIHFETSYEFIFHDFHIGPSLDFAHDPEDNHISVGIHIGYGF